jgi:hypothetical protein
VADGRALGRRDESRLLASATWCVVIVDHAAVNESLKVTKGRIVPRATSITFVRFAALVSYVSNVHLPSKDAARG